jgi:hypothetical protein
LRGDGHLLVEGPPRLAKTRAIKALAHAVEGNFQRVQFTPDMLPAELTGAEIYRPEEGTFRFQRGPLFHNLILDDEEAALTSARRACTSVSLSPPAQELLWSISVFRSAAKPSFVPVGVASKRACPSRSKTNTALLW